MFQAQAQKQDVDPKQIKTVHLVFMNHLGKMQSEMHAQNITLYNLKIKVKKQKQKNPCILHASNVTLSFVLIILIDYSIVSNDLNNYLIVIYILFVLKGSFCTLL